MYYLNVAALTETGETKSAMVDGDAKEVPASDGPSEPSLNEVVSTRALAEPLEETDKCCVEEVKECVEEESC